MAEEIIKNTCRTVRKEETIRKTNKQTLWYISRAIPGSNTAVIKRLRTKNMKNNKLYYWIPVPIKRAIKP